METTTPWGFEAPTAVIVPSYHVDSFIYEAPVGTVIDVADDLYKKATDGEWIELEHVVTGYSGMGGAYAEHETTDASALLRLIESGPWEVRVLRLG